MGMTTGNVITMAVVAVALLPESAMAARFEIMANGSQLRSPVTAPGTAMVGEGDLPADLMLLEEEQRFFLVLSLPGQGNIAGKCVGGALDGQPCAGDTCPDGECEIVCDVSIWAESDQTDGVAVADVWAQASPATDIFSTNEGIAQGSAFTGSATVPSLSRSLFKIEIDGITLYSAVSNSSCTVQDCAGAMLKLLVGNGGTVPWYASAVTLSCPLP